MPDIHFTSNITSNAFEDAIFQKASLLESVVFNGLPEQTFWEKVKGFFIGVHPVSEKVKQLLKEKIHYRYHTTSHQTDAICRQLLSECGEADLKAVSSARKVFAAASENIEVVEALPSLYKNFELEKDSKDMESQVRNVIKMLMGASFAKGAISARLVKAVLLSKDQAFMKAFIEELQRISKTLYNVIGQPALPPAQERLAEILIGNILALYPFAEPENGSILQVPRKINGTWRFVDYRVDVLELTPQWVGSPVPAIGLVPENAGCPPLLLFRGTPQPTASGSFLAAASDAVPGYSVGEAIYEHGAKGVIQNWVQKAFERHGKISLYGQSLGGSLSLLAACHQPQCIKDVHVYGSPGLLSYPLTVYDKQVAKSAKPDVHIYWNDGDIVPLVGRFHEDWHLYRVIPANAQNSLFAHASLSGGQTKNVAIMKLNVKTANAATARKMINIFHQVASFFAFLFISIPVIAFKAVLYVAGQAWKNAVLVAKRIFVQNRKNSLKTG